MVKKIANKRTNKSVTLQQYHQLVESRKVKKKEDHGKTFFIDISRRHKFKKKAEKLQDIEINLSHKIEEIKILPYSYVKDNIGSFFYDELDNMKQLETSLEFKIFYFELVDLSQTLPLILNNKKKIIHSILSNLKNPSLKKEMLKLLPPLIRDCQEELFDIFCNDVLFALIELFEENNLETMELIFIVLAYWLKYLFSQITIQFERIYKIYLYQLFGHHNKYVRKFAAESFSYIFRKLKKDQLSEKISIIINSLTDIDKSEFSKNLNCLPNLLEESVKLNNHFLSFKYEDFNRTLISTISQNISANSLSLFYDYLLLIIKNTELLIEQELNNKVKSLYDLHDFFQFLAKFISEDIENIPLELLYIICKSFIFATCFRQRKKLNSKIIEIFLKFFDKARTKINDNTLNLITAIFLGKICRYSYNLLSSDSKNIMEGILFQENDEKTNSAFKMIFLTSLVNKRYMENSYLTDEGQESEEEKNFLVDEKVYEYCLILVLNDFDLNLFANFQNNDENKSFLSSVYTFYMIHEKNFERRAIKVKNYKSLTTLNKCQIFENFQKLLNSIVTDVQNVDKYQFYNILVFFKIVSIMDISTDLNLLEKLIEANNSLNHHLKNNEEPIQNIEFDYEYENFDFIYEKSSQFEGLYEPKIFSKISNSHFLMVLKTCLSKICFNSFNIKLLTGEEEKLITLSNSFEEETNLLISSSRDIFFLRNYCLMIENIFALIENDKKLVYQKYFKGIKISDNNVWLEDNYFENLFSVLSNNLLSNEAEIRMNSLKILGKFYKENEEDKNILQHLIEIQKLDVNLGTEREIKLFFSFIQKIIEKKLASKKYLIMLMKFLYGYSYVRMSTIWSSLKLIYISLILNNDDSIFHLYFNHLFFLTRKTSELDSQQKEEKINQKFKILNDIDLLESHEILNMEFSLKEIFFDDYHYSSDSIDKLLVLETLSEVLYNESIIERYKLKILKFVKSFFDIEYLNKLELEKAKNKLCLSRQHNALPQIMIEQNDEFLEPITKGEENNNELIELIIKRNEFQKKSDSDKEMSKTLNKKIFCVLNVMSKMISLKGVLLEQFFLRNVIVFLKDTNENIQKKALDCLGLFEKNEIRKHKIMLENLQNAKNFKKEIMNLNGMVSNNSFSESARKELMPVIISLLYPRLFDRRGKKKRQNLDSTKTLIFNFFSNLPSNSLSSLLDLLLERLNLTFELDFNLLDSENFLFFISTYPLNFWIGYLNNVKLLFSKLGMFIKHFVKKIIVLNLALLQLTITFKNAVTKEEKERTKHLRFKELNKLNLQRIAEFYEKFVDFPEIKIVNHYLTKILHEKIIKLTNEAKHTGGILNIFKIWGENDFYHQNFEENDYFILEALANIYSSNVDDNIIECVNKIFIDLFEAKKITKIFEEQFITIILFNIQKFFLRKTILQKNEKSKKLKFKPSLSIVKLLLLIGDNLNFDNEKLLDEILTLLLPLLEPKFFLTKLEKRSDNQINLKHAILEIISKFLRSKKTSSLYEKVYDRLVNLLLNAHSEPILLRVLDCLDLLKKFEIRKDVNGLSILKNLIIYDKNINRNLDYDKVLPELFDFNTKNLNELNIEDVHLILIFCFNAFEDAELSMRTASLAAFMEYFSYLKKNWNMYTFEEKKKILFFFEKKFLMNATKLIKNYSQDYEDVHLKTYFLFVDLAAFHFKEILDKDAEFNEMQELYSKLYLDIVEVQNKTDSAQDFFPLAFDVQISKRLRAVNQLIKFLKENQAISQTGEEIENPTTEKETANDLNPNIQIETNNNDIIVENNNNLNIKPHNLNATNDEENHLKTQAIINEISEEKNAKKPLNYKTINELILPILNYNIFEKSIEFHRPDFKMPKTELIVSHYKSLLETSIEAYTICVCCQGWSMMQKHLKNLVEKLEKDDLGVEKVAVKLICSILNHLPLAMNDIVSLVNAEAKTRKEGASFFSKLLKSETTFEEQIIENNILDINTKENIQLQQNEIILEENNNNVDKGFDHIYKFLRLKVLIPLKNHMFEHKKNRNLEGDDRKIRIFLAVAIVKLLRKFPTQIFLLEFPKVIANICNALKSRSLETRDNARKALTEIINIMGPHFLYNIIKEMNSILKLGYQKHVLNYTVFTLLSAAFEKQDKYECGDLDYILDLLVPILMEEITGIVQEEKEAVEMKKTFIEMKKSHVFECFYLVSKNINFENSIFKILNYIKMVIEIEKTVSTKTVNKSEEVLRNLMEGLLVNPSLNQEYVLYFCYSIIEESLKNMKPLENLNLAVDNSLLDYNPQKGDLLKHNKAKTYGLQLGAAQGRSIFKIMNKSSKQNKIECGRIFASFSIKFLSSLLRKNFIMYENNQNPDILNNHLKLEPIIFLIIQSLDCNNNTIISNSLKILQYVIKWPLITLKKNYKKTVNSILNILQNLSATDIELIQECFKLLTSVIENNESKNYINERQMKLLIEFIEQFALMSEKNVEALACLKMLILKKFVRAEIYTLVEKVEETMITSFSKTFQNLCKEIIITFLVEFPITEQVIEKHLFFFLKYLEYEDSNGRSLVVDIIHKILTIFPSEVIDHYNEMLFLSLNVAYQNETVEEIKNKLKQSLYKLLNKLPKPKQKILLNHSLSWINDSKKKLQQVGFESLTLFLEFFNLQENKTQIFEITKNILEKNILEFHEFLEKKKESIKLKKQLKNSNWKNFLYEEEDLNLEKEKTNIENVGFICTIVSFFEKSIKSMNKKLAIEMILGMKEKSSSSTGSSSLYKPFIDMFLSPNEKVVDHLLDLHILLLEEIMNNLELKINEEDLKIHLFEIIHNLTINFKGKELLEETEDKLIKTLLKCIEVFLRRKEEQTVINFFYQIKILLLKALSNVSKSAFKIKRIAKFARLYLKTESFTPIFNDSVIEYISFVHVKIKGAEQNITSHESSIIEINEMVVEKLKSLIDYNKFFSIFSKVKSEISKIKIKRKREQKEIALINPAKKAEMKKVKNLKAKQTKKKKMMEAKGKTFKKIKL